MDPKPEAVSLGTGDAAAEQQQQQQPPAVTSTTAVPAVAVEKDLSTKQGPLEQDASKREPLQEPSRQGSLEEAPEPTAPAPRTATPGKDGPRPHTPPKSTDIGIDKSKPEDFDGDVSTTNELPSADTIGRIENYLVLDRDGKSRTFKSLYSGNNVARRVLVIFIRHFFCGNCQEYLRTLSESVTPEALLRLPVSTFVAVVGCGDPALIDMYAEATGCPFPIYTDPTRSIFDQLGMTKTLALGSKPAYIRKSLWRNTLDSIGQGLRVLPKGLALKSGDPRQVGGEFLFEPLDLVTPITTPRDEGPGPLQDASGGARNGGDAGRVENKVVTWCHRMKNTRDHAELPELMEVLGLDGQSRPIKDRKRWTMALETRKGTGWSMASQMKKMNEANEADEAKESN
ncbi:uncharacterized protein UV8b_00394 [Ustilaginoidea virens]|uniref:FmHP n=1 Tax=Ustilaginoidea virens TaxID=1159556 RepID=A0A8E5HIR0_USTVR|nr:uncharacterized protein UV8b_00394 [Ustilaginoidea virens]QUC16153.1 hypothetical protein UV8b_00394 [Ustilaginoidea virens]